MTQPSFLTEFKAGIFEIRLNRPEIHNAFDDVLIKDLTKALLKAKQNPEIKAVVLAANGKHFSAGADLNWMQRMAHYTHAENVEDAQLLAQLLITLDQFPKPTLALVQGAAFGGAIGLITCCDIALASENAYFCFSETKLGLVPAVISPYAIRAMGERQARRYFLTAERFDAYQAQSLGLIHQVISKQSLDEAGQLICQQLQTNCPTALVQAKQLIGNVAARPLNKALVSYTCEALAEARLRPATQHRLKNFLRL